MTWIRKKHWFKQNLDEYNYTLCVEPKTNDKEQKTCVKELKESKVDENIFLLSDFFFKKNLSLIEDNLSLNSIWKFLH